MTVNEKLVHFSIFGIHLVVLIRLLMIEDFREASHDSLLGLYRRFNSRYFTKWNYIVLMTYYACMVTVHLLDFISVIPKLSKKLRSFADAIFTIIVVPAGMFISIGFWIVYYIDRDLIFPTWLEEIIPAWVNHGIHTLNSILPFVDLLLVKHTFSPWSETIYYSAVYIGSYTACLFGTFLLDGFWLYPLFEKMTSLQRIFYCIFVYLLVLLFHYTARIIGMRMGTSIVKINQKEKNRYSNKSS